MGPQGRGRYRSAGTEGPRQPRRGGQGGQCRAAAGRRSAAPGAQDPRGQHGPSRGARCRVGGERGQHRHASLARPGPAHRPGPTGTAGPAPAAAPAPGRSSRRPHTAPARRGSPNTCNGLRGAQALAQPWGTGTDQGLIPEPLSPGSPAGISPGKTRLTTLYPGSGEPRLNAPSPSTGEPVCYPVTGEPHLSREPSPPGNPT